MISYASRGMTGRGASYVSRGLLDVASLEGVEFPEVLLPVLIAAFAVGDPSVTLSTRNRPDPSKGIQVSAVTPTAVTTISTPPVPQDSLSVQDLAPTVSTEQSSGPVPSVRIKK